MKHSAYVVSLYIYRKITHVRMKIVYTFLSIVLIFLSSVSLSAQSADAIRKDPTYLSGEGKAFTLDQAKKYALNEILNQITMTVKSDFTSKEREQNSNGSVIRDIRKIGN